MAENTSSAQPLVEPRRPFTLVLAQLEGGKLADDLTDQLIELNAALSEHSANHGAAKGSLVIKLDFRMEGAVIEVQSEVKIKTPTFKRERSMFWLTPGNQLSGENPKQLKLGIRSAPADDAAREAAPAPAARQV